MSAGKKILCDCKAAEYAHDVRLRALARAGVALEQAGLLEDDERLALIEADGAVIEAHEEAMEREASALHVYEKILASVSER